MAPSMAARARLASARERMERVSWRDVLGHVAELSSISPVPVQGHTRTAPREAVDLPSRRLKEFNAKTCPIART